MSKRDEPQDVIYGCTSCSNTQTIRFFAHDRPLPVTCCVKCRAGFGVELQQMLASRVGMFPVK